MLVLTRKCLESIVIGGGSSLQSVLKVTVMEIRGGKVKLAFEADPSISIHRSEIWERIHAEEMSDGPTPILTTSDSVVTTGSLYPISASGRKVPILSKE